MMLNKSLIVLSSTFGARLNETSNGILLHLMKKFAAHKNYVQFANFTIEAKDENNLTNENHVQIAPLLNKYIQQNCAQYRSVIPSEYLKPNVNITNLYLINSQVAKEYVSLIQHDLLNNMSHVVELNPGLGFLTKELLQIGVPFVHAYEQESQFCDILNELSIQFPNQLKITNLNLFDAIHLFNIHTGSKNKHIEEFFSSIPQKKWEEKPNMQIIGATPSEMFIRHLIMSTIFQSSFMTHGRQTFYLAIPTSLWNKFVSPKTVSTKNIMFQVLFNYELLGNISRIAFIPWQRNRKRKQNQVYRDMENGDSRLLYVIKLEPKPDLLEVFHGKQNIINFWQFIRHNLYRSSKRVIPALEKVIPNCGIKLIAKDFNVYTKFSDLTATEIRDLFLEIQTWPGFNGKIFATPVTGIKSTTYLNDESTNLSIDDNYSQGKYYK